MKLPFYGLGLVAALAVIAFGGCGVKMTATAPLQTLGSAPATLSAYVSFGSSTYFSNMGVPAYVNGNLWIPDPSNNVVEEWATVGGGSIYQTYIYTFNGSQNFNFPWGVSIDPATGDLYVGDQNGGNVEVFDPSGNYLTSVYTSAVTVGPEAVAINSSGTKLYVLGFFSNLAYEFPITPGSPPSFGAPTTFGTSSPALNSPYSIRLDASGNVWVADHNNGRLAEFSSSGVYQRSVSAPTLANFTPSDLAFDPHGNLFVTDDVNGGAGRIVEFKADGSLFTTVGGFLSYPDGIIPDGQGTYYVTSAGTQQVFGFH